MREIDVRVHLGCCEQDCKSERIIHIEDAKTLYKHADFPFPLDAYLHEEIVRCRDCEHASGTPEHLVCRMPCGDATAGRAWCEPDGFCAWGERRGACVTRGA